MNPRAGWRKPALLLVLALTVAGAATGCGSDSSDNDSSADRATGETGSQVGESRHESAVNGRRSGPPPAKGKPEQDLQGTRRDVRQAIRALNTVNDRFRDGTPYDLEETTEDGTAGWEIKVAFRTGKPLEFIVSRNGNRIISQRKHKPDGDAARANRTAVKLASALALSGKKVDGNLDEAGIDRDGGRIVWKSTFKAGSTEHEVFVDARNGKLLRVRTDRD